MVVVEEAEVVTRPLATTSVISGSCTSMTSPGFNIAEFSPEEKLTTSCSVFSVTK